MKSWLRVLIFIPLVASGLPSFARELFEVNRSVRALGMGNAYSAIVNDRYSLFYNPAGLSKVKGIQFTILDLSVGADGTSALDSYMALARTTDMASSVRSLYGKDFSLSGGGLGSLVMPNVGFAIYDHVDGSMIFGNPAYPTIDTNFISDFGMAAGFSFGVPFVSVGIVGKRINRYGGRTEIGIDSLASLSTEQLKAPIDNKGTGYGIDVGVSLVAPAPGSPTLSLVIKDFGTTTFVRESGVGTVPMNESEWVAGMGLDLDLGLIEIRPAIDVKHLMATSVNIGKKIHAGIEVGLPLLSLRAGISQGYYTLGAGLSFGVMQFNAATYGVEMGEYAGQKEDRRYIAEFVFEIDFGNLFGGGGSSGGEAGRSPSSGPSGSSRSRLKPRR